MGGAQGTTPRGNKGTGGPEIRRQEKQTAREG